jgi:hypothetical protein
MLEGRLRRVDAVACERRLLDRQHQLPLHRLAGAEGVAGDDERRLGAAAESERDGGCVECE